MSKKVKVDTPEQAEFRAYCREWLSENKPGPWPPPAERRSKTVHGQKSQAMQDFEAAWQRKAYEGGLVGCDYPKEYGGGGRTDCQRVANEEMQRLPLPGFPNYTALVMAAATIMTHGSEYLKKRFIPKMFSCEEMWCQGFSEPNAGSDIANQETFAEKKGDMWIVNGQKIWTSNAEWADWMILLTRTDRSEKHKGLTYFVAPVKGLLGKSVDVRPLIKLTGEAGFNEMFLTDLEIPDKHRLDEVGSGWAVAMTTLKYERDAGEMIPPSSGGGRAVSGPPQAADAETPIVRLAKASARNGKTAADDPAIRDRIMKMAIRQAAFAQTNRRGAVKGLVDHPSRIPLQIKLVSSELGQDLTALAVDIGGAASTLRPVDKNAAPGAWSTQYLHSFGITIAEGTSEIQRNQIGERVLGLPKSR